MRLTYRKVETSKDVYSHIRTKHADSLIVFGTVSHPCGDQFGNPDEARMYTEWGFKDSDVPLVAIDERWAVCRDAPNQRNEYDIRYYLFAARENDDDAA